MNTQEKERVDFNEFTRDGKIITEYVNACNITLFKGEYHVGTYYGFVYFEYGIFKTLDEAKERVISELLRENRVIKDEIKEIKGVGTFRKEQKELNGIPFVSQQTMGDGSKRYRLGFVSNKGEKDVSYSYASNDIFYDTKEEAENALNAIKKDYVLEEKPIQQVGISIPYFLFLQIIGFAVFAYIMKFFLE
jgi:hypothetical protein